MPAELRHLALVLGDQLNRDASAWGGFDPRQDAAWMAEVAEESTHVWSARQRSVLIRLFAEALRDEGVPLHYRRLDDAGNAGMLAAGLEGTLRRLKPQRLPITEPGDWRVVAMNCLRDAITQTLEHGYAHHIQRLMVTGLYAPVAGQLRRAHAARALASRGRLDGGAPARWRPRKQPPELAMGGRHRQPPGVSVQCRQRGSLCRS
jgi:deoxyribodipyrimidine photolyase-like uncharacterized protein